MFFESNLISDLLKCNHCKQPFDEYSDPRLLTCCSQTVCQRCVAEMEKKVKTNKKKLFKCVACKEESGWPEKGLPVNKLAAKLIAEQPKEVYRSQKCEELKQCLTDLKHLNAKLSFEINNNYEDTVKDHCNEQKRLIQLSYEEKCQEMKTLYEQLVQRVDDYEMKCNQNLKAFHAQQQTRDLVNQVNSFVDDNTVYLNRTRIDEKDVCDSIKKIKELKANIEKERLAIKTTVFSEKLMKFEAEKSQMNEAIIGCIQLESIDQTNNV